MLISLEKLVEGKPYLDWLSSNGMSPGLALEIQRNVRVLKPEYEAYFEKTKAIGEKYGELSKDGTKYNIDPENKEASKKELDEVNAVNVDVNIQLIDFKKIEREAELGTFKISADCLYALDWMFKFPEPEEAPKEGRKRHPAKVK